MASRTTAPRSCDTFVALPPATVGSRVVFGKNSDRPSDEVQEVVYFPAASHKAGDKLEVRAKCLEQKLRVLAHHTIKIVKN